MLTHPDISQVMITWTDGEEETLVLSPRQLETFIIDKLIITEDDVRFVLDGAGVSIPRSDVFINCDLGDATSACVVGTVDALIILRPVCPICHDDGGSPLSFALEGTGHQVLGSCWAC